MKLKFTLTLSFLIFILSSKAVLKTWVGAIGANWSVGANWSPAGTPLTTDDVQFTGVAQVTLDVNPNINSILVSAAGIVEFKASASRTITLASGSAVLPGLKITAGATLRLSQSAANPLTLSLTGGISVTGQVYGTLQFTGTNASASARLELFTGALANGNVTVFDGGIIQYDINTGNTIGNGLTGLQMESGSQYIVNRNGGSMPAGTYKNGSYIRIMGVVANMFLFNNSAIYDGVIEWDCTAQTVNGSAASLSLSSAYPVIDSFVVKSTGATGTLRLSTEMTTAPSINYLLVNGGVLEIASPRASVREMTINNNLEVTGGTLFINATDASDNLSTFNMRLFVNGNIGLSGTGTINFSNRPNGQFLSYGTGLIIAVGNFLQTGGLITETAPLPPINDASGISMRGTALQNLSLTNWTNQVRLVVESGNGVLLQSNIVCPEYFYMVTPDAYVILGNYNLITNYGQYIINTSGSPGCRLLTNGIGHFTVTNVPSAGTVIFPVTPVLNAVSTVTLTNNDIIANSFDVRVERGNNPTGIYNTGRTVNRTWIINDATNSGANSIALSFQYPDTAINALCNRADPMELGHFAGGSWSVDPAGQTRIPTLGSGVNTIDETGTFVPNSLDSAFVLGNEFSILTINQGITLNYFKGNRHANTNLLSWSVNCTGSQTDFEIQRSSNGINFSAIGNIVAGYTRCLQPFDFTDITLTSGISYYRIKITDVTGRVTYSKLILLQGREAALGTMALLPTLLNKPFAILYIDALSAGTIQLNITNAKGSLIQTFNEKLFEGNNQLTLNFEQLVAGVYYINAYGARQKWTTVRFIKQ